MYSLDHNQQFQDNPEDVDRHLLDKNKLQEYCQKQKISLPVYDSQSFLLDAIQIWRSSVTLNINGNNTTFTGDTRHSKVRAEISAATKALAAINNILIEKIELSGRRVLLLDLENLPTILPQIYQKFTGLTIYAFVNEHSPLRNRKYPEEIKIISCSSAHRDGADTCLQLYAGYFLANKTYDYYYIGTRDHFGAALVQLIESSNLLWSEPKIKAKVITDVSHF